MQPLKSDKERRTAWEAPAITKLAIGTETKSPSKTEANTAEGVPGSGQHPQPPAAPASKLGFSIEMAFPLSARLEG